MTCPLVSPRQSARRRSTCGWWRWHARRQHQRCP